FITIKLNHTNYLLWKTQLTPILKTYNLLDLVNSTEPCPPTTIINAKDNSPTPNPAYLSWCQRDQLVLSWINASLSESTLPLVVGKLTSTEAWNTLNQAFGSPSHTRILQLHMQLQNLKKNDSSISTYLQQAKYLADELASAGKILSPEDFNAIIFNNLGSSFHAIVAAISTRTTPVLFPELHSLLTSEEIRIQQQTTTIEIPSANMTTRNFKNQPHTRPTSSYNDSTQYHQNNNTNKNFTKSK
ncbi:UBN2 domain-containing protein, partial [Cephalotus follicularis]